MLILEKGLSLSKHSAHPWLTLQRLKCHAVILNILKSYPLHTLQATAPDHVQIRFRLILELILQAISSLKSSRPEDEEDMRNGTRLELASHGGRMILDGFRVLSAFSTNRFIFVTLIALHSFSSVCSPSQGTNNNSANSWCCIHICTVMRRISASSWCI